MIAVGAGDLQRMKPEGQRDAVAERVAQNDAFFRDGNERIHDAAASMQVEESALLPFLCECAQVDCTTVVQLTSSEYEAVRRDPTHFINAAGHVVNAQGWARVVEERDRYTIVEKIGDAADVAVELDPRGGVAG